MNSNKLNQENIAKEFRFIVYMDMKIMVKVSANSPEEAVEIVEGMDEKDLINQKIIDISTIEFKKDF